jgi:hypothetical protein
MTSSSKPPAVLSVGAVLGDSDSESLAWRRAIGSLGKQVMGAREGVESPLRVNVVFHVDGKLVPNEFTGVRTGRFSKSDSHLLVQAAVPAGPVEDRRRVLLALLTEGIREAEAFARERGIAESLDAIRAIAQIVAAE